MSGKRHHDAFGRLLEIMHTLRSPGGCPWDQEQTHETLRPYLVEETYEVLEAMESGLPVLCYDRGGQVDFVTNEVGRVLPLGDAKRFHDGNVTTDDFVRIAEEVSGQELDDLFYAWLFETEVPDIPELGLYRD